MRTTEINAAASHAARVLVTCFLCVVLVGALFAPPRMAREVRVRETEAATILFGPWPQKASVEAARLFDMTKEQILMDLPTDAFGDVDEGYSELAFKVRNWTAGRLRVLTDAVAVLTLRLTAVALSALLFVPALMAAFYGGVQRREDAKARFSYASPFWMRFRWSVVQLLGLVIAVLTLFPATMPTGVFPLLVGAWVLMAGAMVGGLQKEI